MPLDPGYGETPLEAEEAEALTPELRRMLGSPISKSAIYDIEQEIETEVAAERLISVIGGQLGLEELVSDHFLRTLHRDLYGDVWLWAGKLRTREINIGVAPEMVAVELNASLGTVLYRWEHTDDWTPKQLGIAVHAEIVRVHPFVDGNGRSSRLLADLVYACAQGTASPELYDWDLFKPTYIDLLREFDQDRDPHGLATFVGTVPIQE